MIRFLTVSYYVIWSMCSQAMPALKNLSPQSFDLLSCAREKQDTRQFCTIGDSSIRLQASITTDEWRMFSSVIKNGKLWLRGRDGQEFSVRLEGVVPEIKFTCKWNRAESCAKNEVWRHRVGLFGKGKERNVFLGYLVHNPFQAYALPLKYADLFDVENTNTGVEIRSNAYFADMDQSKSQPLPFARIPKYCSIEVDDFYLGFNSEALAKDLEILQGYADFSTKLLAKAFVLHHHLLDAKRSKLCSFGTLERVLRNVEGLTEQDSWREFSAASKTALRQVLTEFVDVWHEQEDLDIDLQELREELRARCAGTNGTGFESDALDIYSSDYVIRGNVSDMRLYNNALDYERERENLAQIINVAKVIALLAGYELETAPSLHWLINPFVTGIKP